MLKDLQDKHFCDHCESCQRCKSGDYCKEGRGIKNVFNETVSRVKKALKGPRLDKAPPKVRSFLEKNGDNIIKKMWVCRSPIKSGIEKVANWLTNGNYEENKAKLGYDKMYHLFLLMELDNGKTFRIEKNEVLNVQKTNDKGQDNIEIPINKEITINSLFENGEKSHKPKNFYAYDSINNNCQMFVESLLKGSHLLTNELKSFILQDVDKLVPKVVQKLAKGATDLAGVIDILKHGEGRKIKCPSKQCGLYVEQELENEKKKEERKKQQLKINKLKKRFGVKFSNKELIAMDALLKREKKFKQKLPVEKNLIEQKVKEILVTNKAKQLAHFQGYPSEPISVKMSYTSPIIQQERYVDQNEIKEREKKKEDLQSQIQQQLLNQMHQQQQINLGYLKLLNNQLGFKPNAELFTEHQDNTYSPIEMRSVYSDPKIEDINIEDQTNENPIVTTYAFTKESDEKKDFSYYQFIDITIPYPPESNKTDPFGKSWKWKHINPLTSIKNDLDRFDLSNDQNMKRALDVIETDINNIKSNTKMSQSKQSFNRNFLEIFEAILNRKYPDPSLNFEARLKKLQGFGKLKKQAILFDKKKYSLNKANKWLKDHNYKPIKKVHETSNNYRFRLNKPNKNAKYKTKEISDGIKLILNAL